MTKTVEILNNAKKRQGLTLKQLAEKSQLPLGTVNKIMSGSVGDVKADKLQKLAKALNIPSEMFFEQTTVVEPSKWFGLAKIACVSPEVKLADCKFNAQKICEGAKKAFDDGAKVIVFPELCITGYSCGDLFFQQRLCDSAIDALWYLTENLRFHALVIVGLPIRDKCDRLFNAAAVLFDGEILGIVPKANLPTYNEFFEKRIFTPAPNFNTTVTLRGKEIPFGTDLLFINSSHDDMKIAVEICEDIWVADSPSLRHTANGATLVANLSASDESVGKADYRRKLVEMQSAKTCCIYAYCSSEDSDSTSSAVFSAHNIICENGAVIAESKPFKNGYAIAEADFDFIVNERAKMQHSSVKSVYQTIFFNMPVLEKPTRIYDNMPFVPSDKKQLAQNCETILELQARGLAHRLKHTHANCAVLGVSGGSDSTLALLVCKRATEILEKDPKYIVAVTMPCFGTTERTLNNSVALATALGTTVKIIDISASVTQHLKDIDHDGSHNTTYENAQARERTQVLMDIANMLNGLVVGTGDLSENALGWCTFNGDQMSMYAVNATVPKTMVRALIAHAAAKSEKKIGSILQDILDTPVSPELLPPSDGNISQVTENIVGPYELHDYFLYMMVRKGFSPSKIFTLAKLSFQMPSEEIYNWLKLFLKRFFSQQFKRNCAPDGVRVGSVDLTKYSWRMPSDACCDEWLADLERAKGEKE